MLHKFHYSFIIGASEQQTCIFSPNSYLIKFFFFYGYWLWLSCVKTHTFLCEFDMCLRQISDMIQDTEILSTLASIWRLLKFEVFNKK